MVRARRKRFQACLLVVLAVIVRWVLKAARLFFDSVKRETSRFADSTPSGACLPTGWCGSVVLAFAAVVAYPYIPDRTARPSGDLHLRRSLLSLGSSSIIASIIAGYAMTIGGPLGGDRVKIRGRHGRRRADRGDGDALAHDQEEEAVIPNSVILQDEVLTTARTPSGGADRAHARRHRVRVPWRQVRGHLAPRRRRSQGSAASRAVCATDRARGLLRQLRAQRLLDDPHADAGALHGASTATCSTRSTSTACRS